MQERRLCKDRGREWRDALTIQGKARFIGSHQKLSKGKELSNYTPIKINYEKKRREQKIPLLEPSQGTWLCQYF